MLAAASRGRCTSRSMRTSFPRLGAVLFTPLGREVGFAKPRIRTGATCYCMFFLACAFASSASGACQKGEQRGRSTKRVGQKNRIPREVRWEGCSPELFPRPEIWSKHMDMLEAWSKHGPNTQGVAWSPGVGSRSGAILQPLKKPFFVWQEC